MMKRTLYLLFFAFIGLNSFASSYDKIKYLDTVGVIDEMNIRVIDPVSSDDMIKTKVVFENKNDFFVLLDPSKSFFYINGVKFFSKDKEIIIPPSAKRSKVIDSKVKNSQAHALSLILDGFSKTANEKIIPFQDLVVEKGANSALENTELHIMAQVYKGSKLTVVLKVKNIGSDILILNSNVIELKDKEDVLNNSHKRINKILLRNGQSEVVILNFETSGKDGEKNLIWNDALVTAALLPMPSYELVICSNTQVLSTYRVFSPPASIEKEKTPIAVVEKKDTQKSNTPKKQKASPVKAKSVEKKTSEKKPEPLAQASTKRSAEVGDRELHASEIDFGNSEGKFYALLIGVSDYTDPEIPDLDGLPIKDALTLEKVLLENYTFNKEDVKVLQSPTRRDIVIALDNLAKKVTDLDNVLIFYAGHGHYEDDNDIGYWLPKDAEVSNSSNWLYNDQLVAGLRKIKSLHTLLITDACFSGSIFKSRSVSFLGASEVIKKKYQLPSRKAMTSGTLKTVPNKSVFIKYLVDRLEKNKEKYYSTSTLYQEIEQPVGNNSNSLPQFGVIQNVGDEGGDFIFIRKN